jgi:GPH family glycoside/pentoside/hexuronide:cation symporter
MLGNQLFPAALQVFMVVLVQGLGMDPLLWGILYFVPRLFDAVTDPVMGFVSDNTRSRWGRRRPYIFVGAIITGVAYALMWQIDPSYGETYNFLYFLCFSLVFYLGLTIFSTPYVAMGYEMSHDFHERTRLMAVAQWIGQWAWVIAPWFWVAIYSPSLFESPAAGARTLAVWVGMICMGLALVPALFCRTLPTPSGESPQRRGTRDIAGSARALLRGFAQIVRYRPFQKLCAATFLVFNGFNTVAGFSWFIIVYYMNRGDAAAAGTWPAWFGTASALCTCFVVIPIVTFTSQRLGKQKTFILSQLVSIVGYAMFWWCFRPETPWLMLVPMPFFAFGIGGLFTLMMSMTADVCDYDELHSGARREGAFDAVYWWMVKLGLAVAGLLSGVILKVVGFDQAVVQQPDHVLAGLRLAYIIVPVTGAILAILAVWRYELTEPAVKRIRQELERRDSRSKTGLGAALDLYDKRPDDDARQPPATQVARAS